MPSAASSAARRARVAAAWDLDRGSVIIPAGSPVSIAGTDQLHEFHAHPEYVYLSGLANAGAVLTFDPGEGWRLFAPVASAEERVWVGDTPPLHSLAAASGVDRVSRIDDLAGWLERRRGEPVALVGNHDIEANPSAYGLESWRALEPVVDRDLSARLSEVISEARRAKDDDELALMRMAAAASRAGHLAGLRLARPDMTERELQVEIEAAFFRSGADRTAYGSIVGSGPNGAVLHFSPTRRRLADGDLVLVDAGGEIDGYASDVTRTYPVGRRFTGVQRDLYQLVLAVQESAIAAVRPGVEYRDLHLAACRQLASGLVDVGILRGDPDDLVERDAHALFFPHGLGHMLGLATHDAGGCLAGRRPSERFGLKYLRADLPLQPGYVVTIEPGFYVIPALLDDPARRESYASDVDWTRVDRDLVGFGGIRIEDDVLVTADGADVLSADIPKSIEAIEALREEALGR